MRNALLALSLTRLASPVVQPRTQEPTPVVDLRETYLGPLLDALTEHCPLNAPAHVQVHFIDGNFWGTARWQAKEGRYLIEVDSRQAQHSVADTLIHEWAHAMVWDATQRDGDDGHGPLWGVAYARCYRVMLDAYPAAGGDSKILELQPEVEDLGLRPGGGVSIQFGE